jgi:zinc metalloprotease ZmpB
MFQEFSKARKVYINRDAQGVARELLHFDSPVAIQAASSNLIAAEYLRMYGDLFGITPAQLNNVGSRPSQTLTDDSVEYRLLKELSTSERTTTVALDQTDFGIPVWHAGVGVNIRLNPTRVVSSVSTLLPGLKVEKPTSNAVKRLQELNETELTKVLGLSKATPVRGRGPTTKSLKIESRSLVIYRYQAAKRVAAQQLDTKAPKQEAFAPVYPTLPLPAVPDAIREGGDYVSAAINFSLPYLPSLPELHWVAIVEASTLTVLYLRAFIENVNGEFFQSDPITSNGGPLPIGSTDTTLDPVRVSQSLPGLNPPVAGTQSLVGQFVQVVDVEPPTIAPPTEPSATPFNFESRTDNFSAVNAYFHCDRFFRLLQSLGFDISTYFGLTTFPASIDHRGSITTTNGLEVNAHCVGNAGGAGMKYTSFMLADVSNTTTPLGIADDYRVALHELAGHCTLWNHVNSPNYGFSHSSGDSVAAILNDPGSQATDRFQSFPWMYQYVARRHDRDPTTPTTSGGQTLDWGWGGNVAIAPFGPLDGGGYNNEQILSTTLFRAYRSLGGDSTDPTLNTQNFAAQYMTYLIIKNIAGLTPSTNPANASAYATDLITTDLADWTAGGQAGGANGKVIRWAFEKQGLYQPSGTPTPNLNVGSPPAIDVYIDDGRGGEYQYQPNWYSNQSIWNRLAADGGTTHQDPVVNQTNYAYVNIKNRGSQDATGIIVQGFHAIPAIGLEYPNDWEIMTTPAAAGANVPANNGGTVTVGPFEWTPTHIGHECMFMIVTADGDASNASNIQAGDSIPEWRLVPNDNNIGQRNVAPVAGGGGLQGLMASFEKSPIRVKNPGSQRAKMTIVATLPPFLVEKGWRITLPTGSEFPLGPKESVEVVPKLIPGKDFTVAEVLSAGDLTIHVTGYADGILVGGMAYALDPSLKGPASAKPCEVVSKEREGVAKELLDLFSLDDERIKRVRLRKVVVEIDFEDDCC